MHLCSACSKITVKYLGDHIARRPVEHLPNAQNLVKSAKTCELCRLIMEVSIAATESIPEDRELLPLEQWLLPEPITLRPDSDPPYQAAEMQPEGSYFTSLSISLPVVRPGPEFDFDKLEMDLFAQEGTAAAVSGDIGARPTLKASNSEEAFGTLNAWLDRCLTLHKGCRKTVSGDIIDDAVPPRLPTRVLDTEPGNSSDDVKLYMSDGAVGHYAALSHCWGPPAKHPLTTTNATLHHRLKGISWDSLPRSFQDAVGLVRKIGLRYLWVDSLCIIQDAHDDWLRESSRMGLIYERARVTIAASHAHDSTEGLFLERPYLPPPVELPYISSDGKHEGSMYLQKSAEKADYNPDQGPLGKRAWITQEWALSRRVIFYTRGRLVWMCKELCGDETARKSRLRSHVDKSSWDSVVRSYSARKLTLQTDRLIALEGLATEFQKIRFPDRYIFGMWFRDLPFNLLWNGESRLAPSPKSLNIPSWSWASRIGPIRCMELQKLQGYDAAPLCRNISCKGSRVLEIEAAIKQIYRLVLLVPIRGEFLDATFYMKESGKFIQMSIHPEWMHSVIAAQIWTRSVGSNYVIFDAECNTHGWATVDEGGWNDMQEDYSNIGTDGVPKEPLFAVLLMSDLKYRRPKGNWYREHFVLVKPTDQGSDRYQRIGIGIVYSSLGESWFSDCQRRCVCVC